MRQKNLLILYQKDLMALLRAKDQYYSMALLKGNPNL
jgi:hypothetical protein